MKNITVWSGSIVPLTVTQGDEDSVSATITLVPATGSEITVTAPFETVDEQVVADLTFTAPEVAVETAYEYFISENFATGAPLIYPDPNNCSDGQCELPTITVCPLPEAS